MADFPQTRYVFGDGIKVLSAEGALTIRCQSAGDVVCPSGELAAGDAGFPTDTRPFDVRPLPGRYGAFVTLAEGGTSGSPRVAYVSICLRDDRPTRWQQAHPPGFSGDNAVACLGDLVAARAWSACLDREGEQQAWNRLWQAVGSNPLTPFAVFQPSPEMDLNLLVWKTTGDCQGQSYYGVGAGGEVLCLTVDVGVIDI